MATSSARGVKRKEQVESALRPPIGFLCGKLADNADHPPDLQVADEETEVDFSGFARIIAGDSAPLPCGCQEIAHQRRDSLAAELGDRLSECASVADITRCGAIENNGFLSRHESEQ
ncbi:MAG TPA: hypothetical protein VK630_13175, partial [Reyranella sp.]|nr:hypothetical protein [Reyranella sp.]